MISFIILRRELVLESEAGLNIYHEATLGLQFLTSFPHSNKSTYIYNLPKFPHAVHFPSLINAESADTRTMAVSLSIAEFDLL